MLDHASMLAKKIKLLVLDVDGVLTDGGLYFDDNGMALKRFNVQDGFGIKLAQSVGIEIAVITGLNQRPVESRIRELGITHYYAGKHDKAPLFKEICQNVGVSCEEAAFMGDDWIDISTMQAAGFALSVPNGVPETVEAADWVSSRRGGDGAVREAIMFILEARGLKDEALKQWAE